MNRASILAGDLAEASKKLIAWNQHSSGGYVASPLFSHYGFSWLRDGSFIAFGMDCAGETNSAELFYDWVRRILETKAGYIRELIEKKKRGEQPQRQEMLHTRYHLDGRDDTGSDWGHFQLDGYGAWLWGLAEHLKRTGQTHIPQIYRTSVEVTCDYLRTFWRMPNFDCWEENADHVHSSTLACIYGGLRHIAELEENEALEEVCRDIQAFILENAVHPDGHFVKYVTPIQVESGLRFEIGHPGVDASLFWLCEPFRVVTADHPAFRTTLRKIERELRTDQGGIRRYADDSYYGGGEWLLLTAWYGWIQLRIGNKDKAERALSWIVSKADRLGRLPEQVPDALASRERYDEWVGRWGTPALPLLWSHAMYLVLYNMLKEDG
ncbi:glycoside hydrolase family 15 protein [Paenibacillus allorhizosphaerae]|nr:glycoside hydrolase family 15 protein [Paenibacillus allorhizosphaerae]